MRGKTVEQILMGTQKVSLRAPHDFSFLQDYGQVFTVIDTLISGNICFGVQNHRGRFFLKYAGAQPINYNSNPQFAIARLQQSAVTYQVLQHPFLNRLLDQRPTKDGYCLLFPWVDGFIIGPQREYYHSYLRTDSLTKLQIVDSLFSFFVLAADHDYVPGGLSEHHFIFQPQYRRMILSSCTDFFPMAQTHPRGYIPGNPIFLPSEAKVPLYLADETTMLYQMRAWAAYLLQTENGDLPPVLTQHRNLMHLLQQPVSGKADEFKSCAYFLETWREAVATLPLF